MLLELFGRRGPLGGLGIDVVFTWRAVVLAMAVMSLPILLQIIGAQYLVAKVLSWFPLSGFAWEPDVIARFLALLKRAR